MDTKENCEIGMIGLGVMGRNMLLNMAGHDFAVAGYDRDIEKVQLLKEEAGGGNVCPASTLEEMISVLRSPRVVMMLVPAGPAVDAVIRDLLVHLKPGDVLIDGGNSLFSDTELRMKTLEAKGLNYLGAGISGGEKGARYGASFMAGGSEDAYARVKDVLSAVAAKVEGQPCAAYTGPAGSGHYVKMVHNGIEYGLMELIAESYDMMKRALNLPDDRLQEIYSEWNRAELGGFLMEITADIFREVDEKTGKRLVEVILDSARQLGTGRWTSQDAMDLNVPVPTIDAAVAMRNLSSHQLERAAITGTQGSPVSPYQGDREAFIGRLRRALYAASILTYSQGMDLLRAASREYQYDLRLEEIARIWRGGCIIRAEVLSDIQKAYEAQPGLVSLLVDAQIGHNVKEREADLRFAAVAAAQSGIPVPGLMASLGYLDAYRSGWLPMNLVQAQRDYFGAHTYERKDQKGVFHTEWE